MDTQWPQYIVFDQPDPNSPPEYAGSVHAPDDEMALLNARDVFARRPNHASMWVVQQRYIFARTRQELTEVSLAASPGEPAGEKYILFTKASHKAAIRYFGEVQAASPEGAMAAALQRVPLSKAVLWWVVPAVRVVMLPAQETPHFFNPAHEKPFRHQSHYHVVTLMREAKKRRLGGAPSQPGKEKTK